MEISPVGVQFYVFPTIGALTNGTTNTFSTRETSPSSTSFKELKAEIGDLESQLKKAKNREARKKIKGDLNLAEQKLKALRDLVEGEYKKLYIEVLGKTAQINKYASMSDIQDALNGNSQSSIPMVIVFYDDPAFEMPSFYTPKFDNKDQEDHELEVYTDMLATIKNLGENSSVVFRMFNITMLKRDRYVRALSTEKTFTTAIFLKGELLFVAKGVPTQQEMEGLLKLVDSKRSEIDSDINSANKYLGEFESSSDRGKYKFSDSSSDFGKGSLAIRDVGFPIWGTSVPEPSSTPLDVGNRYYGKSSLLKINGEDFYLVAKGDGGYPLYNSDGRQVGEAYRSLFFEKIILEYCEEELYGCNMQKIGDFRLGKKLKLASGLGFTKTPYVGYDRTVGKYEPASFRGIILKTGENKATLFLSDVEYDSKVEVAISADGQADKLYYYSSRDLGWPLRLDLLQGNNKITVTVTDSLPDGGNKSILTLEVN